MVSHRERQMYSYSEIEKDFFHYLSSPNSGVHGLAQKSYITWLRFLNKHYTINTDITDEDINRILDEEKEIFLFRDKYKSPRDIKNFRSALMKFKEFIEK